MWELSFSKSSIALQLMVSGQPGRTGTATMDSVKDPVHAVTQCILVWTPAMELKLMWKRALFTIASVLEVRNLNSSSRTIRFINTSMHILDVCTKSCWSLASGPVPPYFPPDFHTS